MGRVDSLTRKIEQIRRFVCAVLDRDFLPDEDKVHLRAAHHLLAVILRERGFDLPDLDLDDS